MQTARHFDNRKQAAIRIDLKLLISEPRFVTTKERSRKSQKCRGAPTWNIDICRHMISRIIDLGNCRRDKLLVRFGIDRCD